MIKIICIVFLLTVCTRATVRANSLTEANVSEDLRTILHDLRSVYGEAGWREKAVSTQAGMTVSSGSAYSIFEAPSPDPDDYTKLAAQIRDGIFQMHGLKVSRSGSGGIKTATEADRYGRAEGTWRSSANPEDSRESICVTVQVVPVRSGRLGVLVSYIYVRPSA